MKEDIRKAYDKAEKKVRAAGPLPADAEGAVLGMRAASERLKRDVDKQALTMLIGNSENPIATAADLILKTDEIGDPRLAKAARENPMALSRMFLNASWLQERASNKNLWDFMLNGDSKTMGLGREGRAQELKNLRKAHDKDVDFSMEVSEKLDPDKYFLLFKLEIRDKSNVDFHDGDYKEYAIAEFPKDVVRMVWRENIEAFAKPLAAQDFDVSSTKSQVESKYAMAAAVVEKNKVTPPESVKCSFTGDAAYGTDLNYDVDFQLLNILIEDHEDPLPLIAAITVNVDNIDPRLAAVAKDKPYIFAEALQIAAYKSYRFTDEKVYAGNVLHKDLIPARDVASDAYNRASSEIGLPRVWLRMLGEDKPKSQS